MKKVLRYFQNDAINAIIEALKNKDSVPYANCCTGFGKSVVMADLTDRALKRGKRVLQLVPNHTLCAQNYEQAYNYVDEKHAIGVCSAKIGKFQTNRKAVVATQTSFLRRRHSSGAFDVLIIDECFTGDTLVLTPNGEKRIDQIRRNDLVYNASGTGFVNSVSVKHHKKIYKIRLSNGKEIKTTNNHPILTQYGWIESQYLDKRHIVFSLQNMRKLRSKNISLENYWKKKKIKTTSFHGSRYSSAYREIQRKKVLLNILLKTERTQQQNSWSYRKNVCDLKKNWSQTSCNGRKWTKTNGTANINGRNFRPWMGDGISDSNKNTKIIKIVSNLLQSGYRQQREKDSYRARRGFSQWEKEVIRREKRQFSKFARVESVSIEESGSYTPMYNLSVSGHPSYFAGGILVHNCDMVSTNENTTYQKIIAALLKLNPKMRIVGLTGSPWRQDQGCIHEPVKEGKVIFTECCYESDIPRLINEGYLSSVKILNTHFAVNLEGVHIKNGDYDQAECGIKFNAIVADAVCDFKQLFAENSIKTVLIFASTIENGLKIVAEYGNEKECKLAHGDLSTHERNELIKWLKDGHGTRCLVNVGLYTRGFDFPALEAIVLLRATSSLRLYVQIIGRLIRAHEEKECGFLADYGSNVERFGPIDNITPPKPPKKGGEMPRKQCLAALEENIEFEGVRYRAGEPCEYGNLLSTKKCKKCGAEFISENEEGKYIMRTKAQILQSKRESSMETYPIDGVYFEKAYSRTSSAAMVKMLFYEKEFGELVHTHYLCLDHAGIARINAIKLVNNLLKNERDFYEISKTEGGCNVENMLMLLQDAYTYQQYFKTFDTITIMPEGRFKSLVKYKFKAE